MEHFLQFGKTEGSYVATQTGKFSKKTQVSFTLGDSYSVLHTHTFPVILGVALLFVFILCS